MPPLKFNQLVCGVVFPCMGLNTTDNLLCDTTIHHRKTKH